MEIIGQSNLSILELYYELNLRGKTGLAVFTTDKPYVKTTPPGKHFMSLKIHYEICH